MDITVNANDNIRYYIETNKRSDILLMDVTYHFKALKNEKKGSVIVNVFSKALFVTLQSIPINPNP